MRATPAKLIAAALTAALLGSCAGAGVHLLEPEDLPRDLYGDEDPGAAEEREVSIVVYFVHLAPIPAQSLLQAVRRTGTTARTDADFALRQLLAGPSDEEVEQGLRPAIPLGTRLLEVNVEGDLASVNVTGEFEEPAEDFVHILRIAQVVWTLTGLEGVGRVQFFVHGVPQPVIDQDGRAHETVSRGRYSRLVERSEGGELDPCPVAEEC